MLPFLSHCLLKDIENRSAVLVMYTVLRGD